MRRERKDRGRERDREGERVRALSDTKNSKAWEESFLHFEVSINTMFTV